MIKKTLALVSATIIAASGFAQSETDYMKTFGQFVYESGHLGMLKLSQAEFDAFVAGIKDAYAGKKLEGGNVQKAIEFLNSRMEKAMQELAKKVEAESAAFWKELEKDKSINKTPTGLAYKITKEGDGKFPAEDSEVVINYTGKLINGKVFDTTSERGEPAKFGLGNVIPGFREGLQKISKGGKATLYIPAELGYGKQGAGDVIPPNSTLIFEVELLDVKDAPKVPPAPAPAK